MAHLMITSYWMALARISELAPRQVLSLMDPGSRPKLPLPKSVVEHETIWLHDIVTDAIQYAPSYVAPNETHVRRLLDLADRWCTGGPVLVHCVAGISRSTAAALILLSAWNRGREAEIARLLRDQAPWASPNELMIRLADNLLSLDGRLTAARDAMGEPTMKGVIGLVVLPLQLPARSTL